MSSNLRSRALAVRQGQRQLGSAPGAARSAVLRRLALSLKENRSELLAANQADLQAAQSAELSGPLLHRLKLDEGKLATLVEGVLDLAAQEDPLGKVLRRTELDQGLLLSQVASPLGVVLIIFESRPDAVIQIGSLAIRSGNGVILKGGSEASASNRALVKLLRQALASEGLDQEAVLGVEGREAVAELLNYDDCIDLVIPRGSGELVRSIQATSRIPVLGHAEGICHLFVDASADPQMALNLVLDGKCGYPAACNATETLLVHRDFLPHLPTIGNALSAAGVRLLAGSTALPLLSKAEPADDTTWKTEHGDLVLGIKAVDNLEAAIDHIHRYGSAHTEAIVTSDAENARAFQQKVDAASVFVNASTRFADGYRYGLGAEVGISTGRIHARGPVGVEGLLTTRWLLEGQGQTAGEYGPGKKSFSHRQLSTE